MSALLRQNCEIDCSGSLVLAFMEKFFLWNGCRPRKVCQPAHPIAVDGFQSASMHLARGQMILAFGLGSLATERVPRVVRSVEWKFFMVMLSTGTSTQIHETQREVFRDRLVTALRLFVERPTRFPRIVDR